jgi:hypothetical protein
LSDKLLYRLDVSDRLRRFALVGGYAIAILHWGSFLLVYLASHPSRFPGSFGSMWLRVSELLTLTAVALLPIGIVGLQFRKRWARTVLLSYAAMWILGMSLVYVWNYVEVEVFIRTSSQTIAQQILTALGELELLIYYCAFPILLTLCVGLTEASPRRILRVLFACGYVLAIIHIAVTAMQFWDFRSPVFGLSRGEWPDTMLRIAAVILLAGTVGLQHRQRWARTVLYAYAVTWILGFLWLRVWMYVQLGNTSTPYSTTRPTVIQTIDRAASELLWPLIDYSVFPIFLVVCLRMPELKDTFSGPTRGFSLVLASVEPVPAEPVPAE